MRRPGEEDSDVDIEGFEEEDDGKPKTPAPVRNISYLYVKMKPWGLILLEQNLLSSWLIFSGVYRLLKKSVCEYVLPKTSQVAQI